MSDTSGETPVTLAEALKIDQMRKESDRIAVARDPATPDEVIVLLSKDKSMLVRDFALQAMKARGISASTPPVVGPLSLLLTTTESVPGKRVAKMLGLVTGVGHPGAPVMGRTSTRSNQALDDAEADIRREADSLGANAVIGVRHAVYSGGNRSMQQSIGVQLLGTAVVLEPTTEADPSS